MERDGRGGSDGPHPARPRARGGAAATGDHGSAERYACPFCGSEETERIGLWGATLLASQYWCHACRTGFDVVRWRSRPAQPADAPAAGAAEGDGAVVAAGPGQTAPGE